MKKLVLISILLFSGQAFSQLDVELSKITGADLICDQPGAMFAFDFERGSQRVWQGDPGETEGIELSDVKVQVYRCPYCYDVNATLKVSDSKMDYSFKIRGGQKIHADITVSAEGQVVNEMKMTCYDKLR